MAVKSRQLQRGLAAAEDETTLDCARAAALLELLAALTALDRRRTGVVSVTALKLLLGLLCAGRLTDRYRYLYAELADVAGAVAELLGERETFGRHLVAGTVASCFGGGSAGALTRDGLMTWLLREPQMLVWVSTLYRLTSAEEVVHSVGCSVCEAKPLVGLCYACLQCLGVYLCQECFFRGRAGRGHKPQHPLQEFCAQWNRRQKTQALLKTLWNKLSGRRERAPDEDPPSSSSSDEDDELLSRTILDGSVALDPRLDSILGHLESENGLLAGELRRLRAHLQSTPMPRLSQLSPIARVPDTPAARDAPADEYGLVLSPQSGAGGAGAAPTSPDAPDFSRRLPDLTEYSLSDLSSPQRVDLTVPAASSLSPSPAVRNAEEALAVLAAEVALLEETTNRGPETWPSGALMGTVPHQTAAELLELLSDLESLCVTAN
ncbi:dystrotelin-like [Pollicipes pollicipes]|uniref:dystrotelin-like n=1 Tax=Pollicipes pollicipes TaxID=41117 RepID=UPI001885228C|nr:dystrotelin-like [Pollicipes pollicipes]